jgi:putative methyltransferase (TIGR04325 family)
MLQLISALQRRLFPPTETIEGYEHPEVVEVFFQKTKAYDPQEAWPEMAGASSVLDFGGGCGLHYKQARSPTVRWAVVETPAMVERAKELATDRLCFFTSIPDAADWLGSVDVMHSNGAIQYTTDPMRTVESLCSLGARKMLWSRLKLSADIVERTVQASNLIDNGPGPAPRTVKNKTVKYGHTRIPEAAFIAAHARYSLIERGADWFRFRSS